MALGHSSSSSRTAHKAIMKSTLCIVFALFLACAQAKKGTEAEFLATMKLTSAHLQEAFEFLDWKDDKKITMEDLKNHYYHEEADFARAKFIQLISTDTSNDVCKNELDAFLKKQPITNAVWECTHVRALSVRMYCFGDQILTYAYLALEDDVVHKFYESIDTSKDNKIKIDEVKALKCHNSKFSDTEAEIFMKEIGGTDGEITLQEFKNYVSEEDLLDDFRACKGPMTGAKAQYNMDCLKTELVDWTMNHLTEKDVMAVFDELEDDNDSDLDITPADLKKLGICSDAVAARFIKLMDKSNNGKVCYAEFRTYVRSYMVRLHLERDCSSKIEDHNAEIQCYKQEIMKRVAENHTPIWLGSPDLDMLFLFEELDKTNNGKIGVQKDLVQGHGWSQSVAQKMINEMDGPDADKLVSLDEFNEFVDWPNIVYGIMDCFSKGRQPARVTCYASELKDNIDGMLELTQVDSFFKFYDHDGSGHLSRSEVEQKGVTGEDVQNYVDEMGMGDDTITYDEFKWYVRQQELSSMYKVAGCSAPDAWHTTVLDYMETKFTQYDTQQLFDALDTDDNWELTCDDVGGNTPEMEAARLRMDGEDKDKTVNFLEFWVNLHTPIGNPRKQHLEQKCTKPHEEQSKEMECYKTEIVNVGK